MAPSSPELIEHLLEMVEEASMAAAKADGAKGMVNLEVAGTVEKAELETAVRKAHALA